MIEGNASCPRVLVDGVSGIEESTLGSSSEAYHRLPEIIGIGIPPILSVCSISSSVWAETGAPDIRHLTSRSTIDEGEEQELPGANVDASAPVRHLLSSKSDDESLTLSLTKNSYEHEILNLNTIEDGALAHTPVIVIQDMDSDSVEAFEVVSSITSSDFSIHPRPVSKFDFSQSLMPEKTTPRRRNNWVQQHRNKNLLVVAPTTPSRYNRPVDSLLTQKEHVNIPSPHHENLRQKPSPVPTNAKFKDRRPSDPMINDPPTPTLLELNIDHLKHIQQNENSRATGRHSRHYDLNLSYFSCENFDPQSPVTHRQKDKKGDVMVEPNKQPATTPKNVLNARCDYNYLL